jgi:hypothetical protein
MGASADTERARHTGVKSVEGLCARCDGARRLYRPSRGVSWMTLRLQIPRLAMLLPAAIAVCVLHASARADGALAVGSTGDVVKFGIAFGMVTDEPKEKAAELALERCRAFKASREANSACEVKATFSRQCYAVALDPQSGTPGAGWGVGQDQIEANDKAMTMCEESAGLVRRPFCQVQAAGCDTKN